MLDLEGRTYRLSRVVRLLALMPLELFVYRPFMALGARQGHVAVPSRGQGLAQVRAQRPGGGRMSASRRSADEGGAPARSLVSVTAAAAAVVFGPRGGAAPARVSGSRPRRHSLSRSRALFAVLVRRRGPAGGSTSRSTASGTPSATCCPRSPTGSCSSATARSARSTAASASCSASSARSCSAQAAPFPFWPPEHRHEIEAWHADLDARGELASELTFRRRQGDRVRVLVSGRVVDDAGRQPAPPRHRSRRLREPPPRCGG